MLFLPRGVFRGDQGAGVPAGDPRSDDLGGQDIIQAPSGHDVYICAYRGDWRMPTFAANPLRKKKRGAFAPRPTTISFCLKGRLQLLAAVASEPAACEPTAAASVESTS
jgi:hypothetical protein